MTKSSFGRESRTDDETEDYPILSGDVADIDFERMGGETVLSPPATAPGAERAPEIEGASTGQPLEGASPTDEVGEIDVL